MAGPTPVSALIHAATMVTAGVYMITRVSFLYNHAPLAMGVVAVDWLLTAVFAATVGVVQNDIKKVFAYSTVSQLGYMFLGVGLGAYSAGIFHLMTHAFFKALLFLGAGSVIHGLGGEQDLRHMGGLRKAMPITFVTLGVASLAISGFPGFSGFFSKDAILSAAYEHAPWMFWVGALTAGLTAFYVFRAYCLAFFGKYRGHHHAHESPLVMTGPLMVLAVLSFAGGFINIPGWLSPGFPLAEHENSTAMAISAACGIIGIAIAFFLYVIRPAVAENLKVAAGPLYTLLSNKYYVDEIYSAAVVKPIKGISRVVLWRGLDEGCYRLYGREWFGARGQRVGFASPAIAIGKHPKLRHLDPGRFAPCDLCARLGGRRSMSFSRCFTASSARLFPGPLGAARIRNCRSQLRLARP